MLPAERAFAAPPMRERRRRAIRRAADPAAHRRAAVRRRPVHRGGRADLRAAQPAGDLVAPGRRQRATTAGPPCSRTPRPGPTWACSSCAAERRLPALRHRARSRARRCSPSPAPTGCRTVHEVEYGARLRDVLPDDAAGAPVLVGGFHGSWAAWPTVASARVSVTGMRLLGVPLGAGVVPRARTGGVPARAHQPDRRLPGRTERRALRAVLQRPAGARRRHWTA